MKRLPLYLLTLLATPVMALGFNDFEDAYNRSGPTNINQSQIGNFTYGSGQIDGKNYNSTSQRIGNFEYQNGRIGSQSFNCTTQYIGSQAYTNCQ